MCSQVPVMRLKPGAGVAAAIGLCSRERGTEPNGVEAAMAIITREQNRAWKNQEDCNISPFAWIGIFL